MGVASDRILLTGVNGQVGGYALPLLRQFGEVVAPLRGELDLSDETSLRGFVRDVKPRWIVNAAAYTAVDKAESDVEAAFAINGDEPRVLGEEAARMGAAVLHFSTDYVFPGGGDRPWVETDATGPLGVYGASKLAGEQGLAASGAAHMIFRTSWVYGATGNNFLRTILRLAQGREAMNIVADQHGAPTSSAELARLVAHVIARSEAEASTSGETVAEVVARQGGVYHACGAGETTWFGFAGEFLRLAEIAEPEQRFAKLSPIASSEYPTPAKRPLNSRMNCDRLERELGFQMPEWRESVAAVMAEFGRA